MITLSVAGIRRRHRPGKGTAVWGSSSAPPPALKELISQTQPPQPLLQETFRLSHPPNRPRTETSPRDRTPGQAGLRILVSCHPHPARSCRKWPPPEQRGRRTMAIELGWGARAETGRQLPALIRPCTPGPVERGAPRAPVPSVHLHGNPQKPSAARSPTLAEACAWVAR